MNYNSIYITLIYWSEIYQPQCEFYKTHGDTCIHDEKKVNTSIIWQKHKTFRYEVWKQNVTDTCSETSSTRTLALLNLLLTAQTLNQKSMANVSDHFMDRRTSPKINTGFPALCLGPTSDLKRTNEISNLHVPVSSSLTRMHSKKAFPAF